MGGQKFQYDESGGTFFYFLLSFLALILIPATFYYWPKKEKEDPDEELKKCQCDGCRKKRELLKKSQPWQGPKKLFRKSIIILGWVALILLAYKVSQFDYEMANFDPYEILGVPSGSSQGDIKKAYRKLSVILHPDKGGNEKEFMKLSKAYQALTDDEARKNWEKYGNPDGPGAMSFGIALPSWIVEKENTIWVLGLYALVFMVALPIVVGTWWYRSIKFSGDQVLLDTTQMYYYFFHKMPFIPLKRVIMILGASLEFDKRHNSEIIERESDNEEVPHLIKKLSNLNEKNKERPLCYVYSIKARAIIYAHLQRIPLNPNTLELDRRYIISKCPYLIQEQINCVSQLVLLAYAKRVEKMSDIKTIENCMKLCPMIVQGLSEFKSPLLQMPYITEDNLKQFYVKKRQIKTLQQFAQLKGDERRNILRHLNDEEYDNLMKFLGFLPYIDFQVKCEVMDDENPTEVTAGAIVTVTVTLIRNDMSALFGDETAIDANTIQENGVESKEGTPGDEQPNQTSTTAGKRPAWLKQKKGGGKKSGKEKKKQKHVSAVKHKSDESPAPPAKVKPDDNKERVKVTPAAAAAADDSGADESDLSDIDGNDDRSSDDDGKSSNLQDEDQEWERIQQKLHKRDKALEGRSKTSHSVHSPLYPLDKQEYWWSYICDRKSLTLLTSPYHVTNLVDREEFQLKFTAPIWPGVYTFTVYLRSDSYIGFDQQKDIKLDVKEAPEEIKEHPQWEFGDSDEEMPAEDEARDSEYTTDDLVEDD